MAGVLEAAVGEWGKVFVSVGLIVSVLGAYLAWTLMSAEVLLVAAKDKDMPRFLSRTNAEDVPGPALLMTTILIQVMLVVTMFSEDAFNFALDLDQLAEPDPVHPRGGVRPQARSRRRRRTSSSRGATGDEMVVAGLATFYTVFLLFAAGPKFILVSFIVYAPATILFVMARREQGRQLFSRVELGILVVSVLGAVLGIVSLSAGWISI